MTKKCPIKAANPRAYTSWQAMKTRCNNPNHNRYEFYGGKGISYCSRWDVFSNFVEDLGERPEGFSLDRIDGEGDYTPDNCRWASYSLQNANKSAVSGGLDSLPRVF